MHGLAARRLSSCVSWALSCSVARGIFLDEESNPCLLQWQVDSDPLYHQGSPQATIFEESFLLWTVADGYHDCALSRSSRDSDTHSRGLPEASTLPSGPLCPVLGSRQDPLSFSFQRLRLTAWEVGQGCHQAHVKYLLCFPEGTGCFSQAGEGFCGSALGEVTGLPGRVVRRQAF